MLHSASIASPVCFVLLDPGLVSGGAGRVGEDGTITFFEVVICTDDAKSDQKVHSVADRNLISFIISVSVYTSLVYCDEPASYLLLWMVRV